MVATNSVVGSVRSTDSVSDFLCSEDDDDESDSGNSTDVSTDDVQINTKLSAHDQLVRVAKVLPHEKSCIYKSIEKHNRSSRLERLDGFISTLADVAVRNCSRKKDTLAVRVIMKAARDIRTRIQTTTPNTGQ
jgi:hypothetical protein